MLLDSTDPQQHEDGWHSLLSPERIAANRRNAGQSTGPGDSSRTRHNAVKHGLLADPKLVLTREEKALHGLYRELYDGLYESLAPVGALEELLADRIASSFWRLRRVTVWEKDRADAISRLLPIGSELGLIQRYEAHLGRQAERALHDLQRLQASRITRIPVVPQALDVTVSGAEEVAE